jgi:hypothetical protein
MPRAKPAVLKCDHPEALASRWFGKDIHIALKRRGGWTAIHLKGVFKIRNLSSKQAANDAKLSVLIPYSAQRKMKPTEG